MLRNKSVILFVGVLFTLVVIYNINFFLKKKVPMSAQKKAVSAVASADRNSSGEAQRSPAFPVPRDREKWRRDPFKYTGRYAGEKGVAAKTAAREIKQTVSIKLQGITVRDGKHFALVNGWVVEAGDMIEDVVIIRIDRYSIFVKDAAGIREINIYDDILDKEN